MNKIVIPAIFAAVLLVGMTFALMPIDKASTVHTTLRSNIEKVPKIITFTIATNTTGAQGTNTQELTPQVTNGYTGHIVVHITSGNHTIKANPTVDTFQILLDTNANGKPDTVAIRVNAGEFALATAQFTRNFTLAAGPATTDQIFLFNNLTWGPGTASGFSHLVLPTATIILNLNQTSIST